MNRRGVLRFLGAAPVAAPVIAREAAKLADVAAIENTGYLAMPEPSYGVSIGDKVPYRQHIIESLQRIASGKEREYVVRQISKVRRLDPDLASSKSLSLSAAMHIQREREIDAEIERRRLDWMDSFKRETGTDWIPESVTSVFTGRSAA
jgi:hypothetical protein